MNFTRNLCKWAIGLLTPFMLAGFASNLNSQTVDPRVQLDIEIDKTVYYTDEILFLLIRIENLSDELLQIVPVMGQKNEAEHDHYASVQSLTSGRMYPIQQHPWRWSWELRPGEITYHNESFALEYRHPQLILAPLPAGEYMLELEIHVTDSNNRSFSLKKRRDFVVMAIADNLPPDTFVQSETMKKYQEMIKTNRDTVIWNAEIRRLIDSNESTPYRNTILNTYHIATMGSIRGIQDAVIEINKRIDIALKRPDDILSIELLRYGRFSKNFNHLYCERFPEVAATGETRLHRYFREFVCKQK